MLKLKHTSTKVFLAAFGAVYLSIFSNLDLNIFIKSYVVIMPVQLLALIYGMYLIYPQKYQRQQYPPD